MSKEYLESLEKIKHEFNCDPEYYGLGGAFEILESALQRLESIEKGKNTDIIDNYMAFKNDNANPSEALEIVDKMTNYILLDEEYGFIDDEEKQSIIKDRDTIKQALLKQQEHNSVNLLMQELDCKDFAELRKYARCGYEKLNKQYLKWEDLEKDRTYKVLLNGIQYELVKRYDDYEYRCDYITLQKKPGVSIFIYEYEKEIFNDLHLERVEE